jgi:alpha-L-arabinofuranosidase
MKKKYLLIFTFLLIFQVCNYSQNNIKIPKEKKISPDLFGIFFEDINYAADGGLYAELLQNRSFEYSPTDRKDWNSFTAWNFETDGFGIGKIAIETVDPLNTNNPHYVKLNIEEVGRKGVGLKNEGFDRIVLKAGEKYNFSVFVKQLSEKPIPIRVKLQDKNEKLICDSVFTTQSKSWTKYALTLTARDNADTASLYLLAQDKGDLAIDEVSLFPQNTFKNRPNGLRSDLAQTIADLHPKFMRFPGGCLVHGDGLGNLYHWENTVGPVEQRIQQKNLWGYHQSVGLGYYEFFQFCEDIGAKPLPVLPAAVSCQNSGYTWSIGGTGQRGLDMSEMNAYIQEVLDLIEWANGPVTSKWGAVRAAAGHPQPFHLEFVGIGNEDKQSPEFRERFKVINDEVKARHPEIIVVGTVGPAPDGEDFDLGWKFAREQQVPIVDEHYYMKPEWFIANGNRYDKYKRFESHVHIGEYASWGSTLYNAIAEAFDMTSLERNGDVVRFASYAPLLAREGHTQWNPDLIYFNAKTVCPTVNYYEQQLFSVNSGDVYVDGIFKDQRDSLIATSCVKDTKTGDIILKIVNAGKQAQDVNIKLSAFKQIKNMASCSVLSGQADDKNTFAQPSTVFPKNSTIKADKKMSYNAPALSLSVIRIKTNNH